MPSTSPRAIKARARRIAQRKACGITRDALWKRKSRAKRRLELYNNFMSFCSAPGDCIRKMMETACAS